MLTARKMFAVILTTGMSVAFGSLGYGAVVQDFNDLNPGLMSGQGGGVGLLGNWAGTGTIDVIAGDLDSPLYSRPQSGTSQSVQGDYSQGRQNNRNLASPMSGSIWFSFLVNNPTVPASGTGGSRGGISFNNTGYSPGAPRVLSAGRHLVVNPVGNTLAWRDNQFTANQTGLVVGQMIVGPGNDSINVWVDPDLMANTDIWNHPTTYSSTAYNFADSISGLGVMTYASGGGTGAIVDNVLLGNSQFAVTGVPEPSTFLIWSLGLLGLAWYARRRRTK